ncbi:RsfA family transcriptional regulator [Cytobacillus sp. IB215665]|uniref:RsfA family transcriptional regulator n=1 Tax=Cytobacillus sp. IB215665 TaxID=3097357 RepID=UPI002A1412F8|nr:RsfA family transcriptional regulator [Cytobacillus sp. IB215665]MDX8364096.1 RsfA family transcriptional regulator [Cytobacillus sp. IB215665]
MKVRQDAWSHEEDLLLAETVLRYIREGGTQLLAFEEVGDKLNRTSAACGFRWNAEVRGKYDQAIAIAKKQRKERKRALDRLKKQDELPSTISLPQITTVDDSNPVETYNLNNEFTTELLTTPVSTSVPSIESSAGSNSISLEDCISYLKELKVQDQHSMRLQQENVQLQQENQTLSKQNKELVIKLEKMSEKQSMIQEDYQALVQIMDRARKMVLFDDNEERPSPAFRMDKNGNLEQLAK